VYIYIHYNIYIIYIYIIVNWVYKPTCTPGCTTLYGVFDAPYTQGVPPESRSRRNQRFLGTPEGRRQADPQLGNFTYQIEPKPGTTGFWKHLKTHEQLGTQWNTCNTRSWITEKHENGDFAWKHATPSEDILYDISEQGEGRENPLINQIQLDQFGSHDRTKKHLLHHYFGFMFWMFYGLGH